MPHCSDGSLTTALCESWLVMVSSITSSINISSPSVLCVSSTCCNCWSVEYILLYQLFNSDDTLCYHSSSYCRCMYSMIYRTDACMKISVFEKELSMYVWMASVAAIDTTDIMYTIQYTIQSILKQYIWIVSILTPDKIEPVLQCSRQTKFKTELILCFMHRHNSRINSNMICGWQ